MYTGRGRVDPTPVVGKDIQDNQVVLFIFPFNNVPGEGHSVSKTQRHKLLSTPLKRLNIGYHLMITKDHP